MNGSTSSENSPSGVQGVCPDGWHVPSANEFTTLNDYVNANNGTDGAAKSLKSTIGWDNSGNGTDAFGFNSIPSGYWYPDDNYTDLGNWQILWTTTEDAAGSYAYYQRFLSSSDDIFNGTINKTYALSVRCVMN